MSDGQYRAATQGVLTTDPYLEDTLIVISFTALAAGRSSAAQGAAPAAQRTVKRASRLLAGLCLVMLAAGLPSNGAVAKEAEAGRHRREADFMGVGASSDVRSMADWVVASGDSEVLPFAIVDKVTALLFVFDGRGVLQGSSPVLVGLARGDVEVPGLGDRKLSEIRPEERITPAGRFVASIGRNLTDDVLWVDYDAALSVHQVAASEPSASRLRRLASETPLDNRVSHGCVVVPAGFFDNVVKPAFSGTDGIVYILPEVKTIGEAFAGYDGDVLAGLR